MTLGEFSLREYAYRRQQQIDWSKHRLTAFMSILAFNVNPKDIPKKLSDVIYLPFVDGETNKTGLSEDQLKAWNTAMERYEKEVKLKNIG